MPKLNSDLYRTLVLTILAGLAVLLVSLSNRDVYSKDVIDAKFREREAYDHGIARQLEHIQEDVEWLVRREGGIPSAKADEDSDTP